VSLSHAGCTLFSLLLLLHRLQCLVYLLVKLLCDTEPMSLVYSTNTPFLGHRLGDDLVDWN